MKNRWEAGYNEVRGNHGLRSSFWILPRRESKVSPHRATFRQTTELNPRKYFFPANFLPTSFTFISEKEKCINNESGKGRDCSLPCSDGIRAKAFRQDVPKFGALAVLLLLFILKKPRPKEDLPFRVPKGLSSKQASCPGALGGRVPHGLLSAGALSWERSKNKWSNTNAHNYERLPGTMLNVLGMWLHLKE